MSRADPEPAKPEALLVRRVRGGDRSAFDELVRRHARRALLVATRLVRNREDAEDLVQESFLIALDRIDRFDASRPFAPWLLGILVHRGLNLLAGRRVREAAPGFPEDLPATGDTPERSAEKSEAARRVDQALSSLSGQQRLVVQLHELDGWRSSEIAEMLGIAGSTVRWTLHEARKNLRRELGNWNEEERRGS